MGIDENVKIIEYRANCGSDGHQEDGSKQEHEIYDENHVLDTSHPRVEITTVYCHNWYPLRVFTRRHSRKEILSRWLGTEC